MVKLIPYYSKNVKNERLFLLRLSKTIDVDTAESIAMILKFISLFYHAFRSLDTTLTGAAGPGFEPRFSLSESDVLPLDDPAMLLNIIESPLKIKP